MPKIDCVEPTWEQEIIIALASRYVLGYTGIAKMIRVADDNHVGNRSLI